LHPIQRVEVATNTLVSLIPRRHHFLAGDYAGLDRGVTRRTPARMTTRRPDRPKGGTVTVKLTLDIPDSAFYPLSPEAVIVVPESMVLVTPIQVIAEDPQEQG
jgi:hypothetical protein